MLTVKIEHDSAVENPMNYGDFKLHSFGRRHSNYTDPTTIGLSLMQHGNGQPIITCPGLRRKIACGTAFFCYYFEHSQCQWGVTGYAGAGVEFRWDGVRYAGLLVYGGKAKDIGKDYDSRLNVAKAVLEEYTDWCNGNCYYFSVSDETGETIESCGGFIGTDAVEEAIFEVVGDQPYEVKGDAAWMAQYFRRKVA